jgi:DNA-binding MarR family transcriptional regulator
MYMHLMAGYDTMARTIAAQCECLRARKAARSLSNLYDQLLKPTGLEISQLAVLAATAHFGERGAQISALADALGIDRTTLTRNLGPLESAGLIRVARSPSDARARVVLLTRAGERAIEAAFPLWEKAQAHVHERVGRRRTEAIRGELEHLVDRLADKAERDKRPKPR